METNVKNRRVVVTGVGVASPLGVGADIFWSNLIAGKSGVRRIEGFDASGFPSQIAGEVPAYRIADHVPKAYRKATKLMARDIELAVIAADDAFKSAGLVSRAVSETPGFATERFGCNIGAGLISVDLTELTAAMVRAEKEGTLDLHRWGAGAGGGAAMNELTPLWLLKYLPNMLACHVTIIHGLEGPSNTIACGEASSHLAIGEAFRTIQRGDADLVICGGAETKVHPMGMMRQALLRRLALESNGAPGDAVRPFDDAASGTAIGEGGGLLILESLESAAARGVTIYAELAGFGAGQDVHRMPDPEPKARGLSLAMKRGLADAGVKADEVDLMIPVGMGIRGYDRAELAALGDVFGAGLSRVPMAPMKSQIGNLAAGTGVEAVAAVLGVKHGMIPPAVNTTAPVATLNVSPAARVAKVDVAVSTAWSLGGQSAALVFRKFT